MFVFKKKKVNNSDNQIKSTYIKYCNDVEDAMDLFPDYYNLKSDFSEELFMFIYRNAPNMIDTMIAASYLRQVEVSLEEVKKVYSLNNEYIKETVSNVVPELRVKANKMIYETIPNASDPFGWNNGPGLKLIYSEFVDRIEYIFEISRNQKKIQNELNNDRLVNIINSNSTILVLSNYFSVRESLVIAFNLGLMDELIGDELDKMHILSEHDFNNLLNSVNIDLLKNLLTERINKLKNIEPETSYFEYEKLADEYEILLNAINVSKEYISGIKKR
ncbi:MAG: hypothetical protein IKN63_03730 [Bacilli bacterium]|nr:hypothetical protein [Bacilli bacterium]